MTERLPLTDAEERLLRALVEADEHFPEPSLTWLRKTLASLDSARQAAAADRMDEAMG